MRARLRNPNHGVIDTFFLQKRIKSTNLLSLSLPEGVILSGTDFGGHGVLSSGGIEDDHLGLPLPRPRSEDLKVGGLVCHHALRLQPYGGSQRVQR